MHGIHPSEQFMEAAIDMAMKAQKNGDYAIGAVIVKDDKIIVSAINATKTLEDPTLHAEMIAISKAARLLGSRHLNGCVLYTTHEPCPMCASAAVWTKLDGIVCGASIEDMSDYAAQNGNSHYRWRTISIKATEVIERSPDKLWIIEGFLRDDCKKLFHDSELRVRSGV